MGKNVIGICKLCQTDNAVLRCSHIIPEFAFDTVYDKKHRFVYFTPDSNDGVTFEQQGFRENLLCQKCETWLSKYEKILQSFLIEVNTNKNNTIKRRSNNSMSMKEIQYNEVKIALLSILYRMSISKREEFRGYSLGTKEEEFRDIIYTGKFTDEYTFPIHVSRVVVNGNFCKDQIATYGEKSKHNGAYTYNSFVIYGLLIDIMLSNQIAHNDVWYDRNLKENGELIIYDIERRDARIEDNLLNRFHDKDVKIYMENLKY